jgi:hypothetical protein
VTTVYFAGTEDIDFIFDAGMAITTNGARFRPSWVRSGVGDGQGTALSTARNFVPFATATCWAQARFCNSFPAGMVSGSVLQSFRDVNNVKRLQFRVTNGSGPSNTFSVDKVDAAGTVTSLFTGTVIWDIPATGNEAQALTWQVNYAVAGSVQVWYKGISLGSFTGDVTTNSVTSLSYFAVGSSGGGNNCFWSEIMVVDFDCRTSGLQTFAPVANGNTHTFDTGTPAAANVNEVTLNLATIDGSTTANQIDEYTTAAVVTGTFDVMAYGVSFMASKGATGPSKADAVIRTGAADFLSADFSLTTYFANYQNWWVNNPNTGVPWLTSQIGSTAGFNIGVKSIT